MINSVKKAYLEIFDPEVKAAHQKSNKANKKCFKKQFSTRTNWSKEFVILCTMFLITSPFVEEIKILSHFFTLVILVLIVAMFAEFSKYSRQRVNLPEWKAYISLLRSKGVTIHD